MKQIIIEKQFISHIEFLKNAKKFHFLVSFTDHKNLEWSFYCQTLLQNFNISRKALALWWDQLIFFSPMRRVRVDTVMIE